LKDEEFSDMLISSCEEEDDSHECESIDTLFHIEKHRWDRNCLYFDGDPIYDIDSETPRAEFSDLVSPFMTAKIFIVEVYVSHFHVLMNSHILSSLGLIWCSIKGIFMEVKTQKFSSHVFS
jgi:hypothetical protein